MMPASTPTGVRPLRFTRHLMDCELLLRITYNYGIIFVRQAIAVPYITFFTLVSVQNTGMDHNPDTTLLTQTNFLGVVTGVPAILELWKRI